MNRKSIATTFMIVASLAGIAALVVIVAYTIQNDSGHSSFNPYLALVIFVPILAFGLAYFLSFRGTPGAKWCGILAVIVGIAGIALLVYLDRTNTLLQYEVWIHRGMP